MNSKTNRNYKNIQISKTDFNRFTVPSFTTPGYVNTFKTLKAAKLFIDVMTAR